MEEGEGHGNGTAENMLGAGALYHMKQVAWYFDRLGENGVDIGAILGDSSGDRRGHLVWALVRSILMWTDARTPPPEELWMPTETRCSQSPSANCSVDFSRGF